MAGTPRMGMDKGEMRTLLKKAAPDKPVNFAFGQGKDPAFALLKLDKMKSPKLCGKALEDEFHDTKNVRWGTCLAPPEVEGLIRFVVNRPVSGIARRLTKTLKGTGFTKVEIVLEDGTVVERAAEEDEDHDGEPAGEAAADAGEAADGRAPRPEGLANLPQKLAGLMRHIPAAIAVDPRSKERLVGLAAAANAALKKTDPTEAIAAIHALARALEGVTGPDASEEARTPRRCRSACKSWWAGWGRCRTIRTEGRSFGWRRRRRRN